MKRLAPLALLLVAASPDAFTRVVGAFDIAARSASPPNRAAAARVLAETDARPVEGTADLAAAWRPTAAPQPAAWRNRALGPAYRVIEVRPGGSVHFEQVFLAGQRARVAVVTRAPFRLKVTDDDGKPQCGDGGPPGRCDWVPIWTTRYSIALDNRGSVPASYYVVMQ